MENDSMDSKELIRLYRNGLLTPEHYGAYWDDDDRQRLKSMFLAGEGISEIALRLERSESSVFQQLVCLGLFADSRMGRTRHRASSGCKCETCSVPNYERPPHCPYQAKD